MDGCGRGRLLAFRAAHLAAGDRSRRPAAAGHAGRTAEDAALESLRQATHRAIAAVTDDLEALRFNRAVAQLYTLANAIGGAREADGAARREALETLVLLIGPMMPHLAENAGRRWAMTRLVAETPWPKHDPALTASDTVTIAVQVNGKRRGEISMAQGCRQPRTSKPAALAVDGVKRALDGKTPKKVIVVPDRIVNIVA